MADETSGSSLANALDGISITSIDDQADTRVCAPAHTCTSNTRNPKQPEAHQRLRATK